ncbi:MAG: hypothetical protein HONBIEJF_00449 [Fimbriimonadaceae bacterium]|nr:hypothetical protein [Fimbriimonadaceae bacterium]
MRNFRHLTAFAAAALALPSAHAVLVHNQIGPVATISSTQWVPNQIFPDVPPASMVAEEDFTLSVSASINYFEAHVRATGANSPMSIAAWQSIPTWQVDLCVDQFGQPGTIVYSLIVTGSSTQVTFPVMPNFAGVTTNAKVRINTNGTLFLAPGTYWFRMTPVEVSTSGRTFHISRSNWGGGFPNNGNAYLWDPFNTSTHTPTGWDLAFDVDG